METWSTPLILAIAAFLALLLWRVRPRLGFAPRGAAGKELREAQARVEAAATGPERALALCDAADRMRGGAAKATYLRALREDPVSAALVARTVAGLSRRPRTLESLLWRYLATREWSARRGRRGRRWMPCGSSTRDR